MSPKFNYKFHFKIWIISGEEDGGYKICNAKWKNKCLAMWSPGGAGTFSKTDPVDFMQTMKMISSFQRWSGEMTGMDIWNIVPLFKQVNVTTKTLYQIDNRSNSESIERESKFTQCKQSVK